MLLVTLVQIWFLKTVVKFGGITILLMVLVQLMMKSSRSCYERKDIVIDIELNMGQEDATVWSCDLSYEYVKSMGSITPDE